MITEEKSFEIPVEEARQFVNETLLSYFERGYTFSSCETIYKSTTVHYNGTPDTYTGTISDSGDITITKHEGVAPHTHTYQRPFFVVVIKRIFKDEESQKRVLAIEGIKGKLTNEQIIFIHKEIYGVLPCQEDAIAKYAPYHRISGSIIAIIFFFLLTLIGLGGLSIIIYAFATKTDLKAGWVLAIAYALIGLVIAFFSGKSVVESIRAFPYKHAQTYKNYKKIVLSSISENELLARNNVREPGKSKDSPKKAMIKSILFAVIFFWVPIVNIFLLWSMFLCINDYRKSKK